MTSHAKGNIRLYLGGDVMTGRGIDQILPQSVNPRLFESYVKDAREYVFLAEQANGKIQYPVAEDYIWGDALKIWLELQPDVRIINLETAITQNEDHDAHKGIHYRMHPGNVCVLNAAKMDICVLSNNHILDWGQAGLKETLDTLKHAHIDYAGAGENIFQAMKPAVFQLDLNRRILVFSAGMLSSGIPLGWAAATHHAGVYYLPELSHEILIKTADHINQYRQSADLVIFSLHWGSNWGYDVSEAFQTFARGLIDDAKVDVIFGHSSHHPRPIEIYHGKPILYGCGDFINDYEGIGGHEEFRSDLTLMYFLDFDAESLQFIKITLVPMQIRQLRLHNAGQNDIQWLYKKINQYLMSDTPFTIQNRCLVYETGIAER
ncbi:Capsule biosynthesis protein CapA [Aquicella siphonis]|uniref:Capsule biosynthesis protein CapA n=1 Tax=Aquicella siphonis TaxID=254247 RepID=A0A5E4PJC3_9COXI|nr:CapA family protein [Aquicella siphonis]VVC77179.1 Capsule biosynthesis protein CapA [Aquicella siphonis]